MTAETVANKPAVNYAELIAQNKFDINIHLHRLLVNEPFFAAMSIRIQKIMSRSLPTAGVRVNSQTARFELFYNPDFFERISDKHKIGVLKHEFYHLIFDHCTTRRPVDPAEAKLWNVATDLAINSHLENELPSEGDFACLFPSKGMFKNMPVGKSAEWYMNAIKKDKDLMEKIQGPQNGQGGQGGQGEDSQSGTNPGVGQFDDHEGWDAKGETGMSEADAQAVREMAQERLKDMLRKAANEAQNRGWGTVSAEMRGEIIRRIQSLVNWKAVLRWFVRTSQRADKYSTIRRINKRYAYIHPGKRVRRQAKIAVAVDMSGSVYDEMLSAFFSELNGLAKIATFTVIPFDTSVDEANIFEWKKGRVINGRRTRCGGTCFEAPTQWVNKQKSYDGLIILTDLMAPKPSTCRVQRMWMTTPECAANPYFETNERIAQIPIKLGE